MTAEQNKALYRRFIQEVFNEGRLERLNQFLAPGYAIREAPPGTPEGAAGVEAVVSMFRGAFPDLQITIDDLIGEDDRLAALSTLRGTHRGSFMGMPAAGARVAMTSLTFVRFQDGKLVESWVKNDVASLMRQLEAAPRPA